MELSYLKPFPVLFDVVISEPRQQERTSIPSNKQLGAAVLLATQRLKPTGIRSGNANTIEANRQDLRNSNPPKVPRACVISGPETSIAIHASIAPTPEDKVTLALARWNQGVQVIETVGSSFVQVVGIESPNFDCEFLLQGATRNAIGVDK